MENSNLDLILDTSALIQLFFGSPKTSGKIRTILSSYENICISNIIRYEFRNIFLDFFLFIELYRSKIKEIRENKINKTELFSELLEEISLKYHQRKQQFGRLRMIYERTLKNYHQTIFSTMTKGLKKNQNLRDYVIDRLETIIWDFKINLKNIYDEISNYILINDLECSLSNWKYFYDAEKDNFLMSEKKTCSKVCNNIEDKILDFIQKNQDYINQILEKYIKLSVEKNITTYDEKLIPVLQNLRNNDEYKIGVRDCKKLGDLFISSIINNNYCILTNNKSHFLLLLLCKEKENLLILF